MRKRPAIERVIADNITVGERHRTVSQDRIDAMVESIKRIGLHTPITVRPVDNGREVMLVAGATRLAAVKLLAKEAPDQWEEIDCFVIEEGGEIEAELWEIDENLARTDLTTEEKRQHVRRRKELWEQQNKGGKSLLTPGGVQKVGFAADTAAATGLSKRRINQLLADPKPRPEKTSQTNDVSSSVQICTEVPPSLSGWVVTIDQKIAFILPGPTPDTAELVVADLAPVAAEVWSTQKRGVYSHGVEVVLSSYGINFDRATFRRLLPTSQYAAMLADFRAILSGEAAP